MDGICSCQDKFQQMKSLAEQSQRYSRAGRYLQADITAERANLILDTIEDCGCPLSHEIATMRRM